MQPNQQTTTTNITPLIWFDKGYVQSTPGLTKIVLIVSFILTVTKWGFNVLFIAFYYT